MRIIARATLREFWQRPNHNDAEQPLKAWYDEVKQAVWLTPHQVKSRYRNASLVGNNRVVFNIHGNKYRLIVAINFTFSIVYIRFIGTNEEYDKVDATTV